MTSFHSKDLSRITTISFDGDATLWDFEKIMRHSLGIVLGELQRTIPGKNTQHLTVDAMIAIRDQVAEESKGRGLKLEEIRLRAFQRTVEQVGVKDDDLAHRLNELYLKHRFEDIELYPDVIPLFDALAPRFELGLLSNGNTYPERCGLDGRFSFAIFAQDVGCEKPDPRIFTFVLEQAGCAVEQLLHVGDSLATDVAGAQNAGAASVWLNRDGIPNNTDISPDFEITSLMELISLFSAE